jgi:hypothetical protein
MARTKPNGRAAPDLRITDALPWERQDGETDPAWAAFTVYRDMGTERSLSKVADHVGKSSRHVALWSSRNDWHVRAARFDSYLDRVALDARVKAIERMEDTHAQVAGGYIAAMVMPLRALTKDRAIVDESGAVVHIPRPSELEKMETATLIAVAESAARTFASLTSIERLARHADEASQMGAQAAPEAASGVPASRSLLSAEDKVVGFLSALRDAGMRVPLLDDLDGEEIEDAEVVDVEPAST